MSTKFSYGDVVVPILPKYNNLESDYFKGDTGKVVGIRPVNLSYEKFFLTVLIRGRRYEFYSSALMLANDNNVARKSISLFWSLFTLQRPYYQLIIFFGLLGFALAFMLGVRLQYPLYDKLIGASFCCGVTIFLVCFIKLLKEL